MKRFLNHRKNGRALVPRASVGALAAVVALLVFAGAGYAQPTGFGGATYMGLLASNSPRGITLTRSAVAGSPSLYHTYRFTTRDRMNLDIRLNVARPDVAVAIFDGNGRFLKLGKPANPRITMTVNKGTYYVRTFGTPNKRTSYRLFVHGKPTVIKVTTVNRFPTTRASNPVLTPRAIPNRPTVTPRTPTRPRVNPVGRISYGGLLYNDHSSNSRLSPTTIRVGGSFRVTSSTMRFSGPGVRTLVALEDVNRRAGSFGVTRFGLRSFRASGNTITIAGPNLALFRNRDFRVVIVTYVNGRPADYTMPGVLRIR